MTRRRRLEEAATRSRRLAAVGRLAGGVAHDLNNRLMTMKGELTLLRDESDRRSMDREALRSVLRILVENAGDAISEAGRVVVGVEVRDRIFEPFSTARPAPEK